MTNLLLERCSEFFHSLFSGMVCNKSYPREIEKYVIEYIAGGYYKVLIEWAKNGMKESDNEMAKIIYSLIV